MRTYDFIKAKQFIEDNKDRLLIAGLGMKEMPMGTIEVIYTDGEYIKTLPDDADARFEAIMQRMKEEGYDPKDDPDFLDTYADMLIAGVYATTWATPVLGYILKGEDTNIHFLECYNGEAEGPFPTAKELAQMSIMGLIGTILEKIEIAPDDLTNVDLESVPRSMVN